MPKVSIGLPVYNGARHIRESLASLQRQTFEDFEILISDNASSDRTEDICREFAVNDPRVHYERTAENIGAAPNFNRIVPRAAGVYFKWAAHDDVLAPEFLARCVAVLDRDPRVVVCTSKARIANDAGQPEEVYAFDLQADSDRPDERFRQMLRGHKCYEVFGVIRTDVLRQTELIGTYAHGDGVLLAELALRGRFHELPEHLFFPRRHAEQSMRMVDDYHAYARWFDPRCGQRFVFPQWRIFREYRRAVRAAPLTVGQRVRCYRHLAVWAVAWRRRLLRDVRVAAEMLLFGASDPRRRRRLFARRDAL